LIPYDGAQKFCGEKMVANITRAEGQTTIGIAPLSSRKSNFTVLNHLKRKKKLI